MLKQLRFENETVGVRGVLAAIACLAALQVILTVVVLHRVAQSMPVVQVLSSAPAPSLALPSSTPTSLSPPVHSPLVLDCAREAEPRVKSNESPVVGPVGGATPPPTRLTCWDAPLVGSGSGH